MKICTKCKNPKSINLFPKRSSSTDGLASWCKECYANHAANKYKTDPNERQRKLKNKQNTYNKNKQYIYEYLNEHPCIDCGFDNWLALEFDHIQEKDFNVSEGAQYVSLDRLKKEIKKCEIRCANCHRIKTSVQFSTWRSGH